MPRLRFNSLKEKLRTQPCVVGCFVEIASPQVIEILGLAGFDFAVIDCEHGAINPQTVEDMIRAANSTGLSPLVRVPQCDPVAVRLPLDMGAAGIHVPQVESIAIAEAAVRGANFYPRGARGMHPFVRSASYRAEPTADYLARANDDVALVLQIEGKGGIADMDKILALPGVDVAFLGPYDLSQALRIPGQVKDPAVEKTICSAITRAAGRLIIGTYCDQAADAIRWRQAGVRYITVGIDAGFLLSSARSLMNELKC